MCDQITFLAEQDDFRFVAICEHDIIHLAWDRFTIYLKPEDLMNLDSSLDRAIASIGQLILTELRKTMHSLATRLVVSTEFIFFLLVQQLYAK